MNMTAEQRREVLTELAAMRKEAEALLERITTAARRVESSQSAPRPELLAW